MANEDAELSQTTPEDGPKGQKMVIYMPQGAVIIERIDVDEHAQPAVANPERPNMNQQVETVNAMIPKPSNPDEHQLLHRIAEILDGITERAKVNEQVQPLTDEISERTNAAEHQILYRIAEILDVVAERIDVRQPAQPLAVVIPEVRRVDDLPEAKAHHINWTKKHPIHWMHLINFLFVAYVAFSLIVPTLLSTFLKTEVYAASSSSSSANVHRGDLMISKLMPVSHLNVNDVVLLRNGHSWNLEVRQVQAISASAAGNTTSITTGSGGSSNVDSYVLNSATRIHKVTTIIPGIGDLSLALTSLSARIGGYLFLFILNIIVYSRRGRRRHVNESD